MKSKKKQTKLRGQFLSGHALWAEVKHASELLQQSHFRAYSLYEDIADLQGSISDAVVHLEGLVKATDEEDVNLEQQKKIRAMLERIRKYYRQMDSASEPFSFMQIAEDLLRAMDGRATWRRSSKRSLRCLRGRRESRYRRGSSENECL